jgi:hypothetical protein
VLSSPTLVVLLGAEVYGIDVRPLAKTIEYLPQDLLVRILVFLPTADYVACRYVPSRRGGSVLSLSLSRQVTSLLCGQTGVSVLAQGHHRTRHVLASGDQAQRKHHKGMRVPLVCEAWPLSMFTR